MIGKVTNPLTVVAIFAAVAESFAVIALVQLPLEVQQIFIWFVIGFPLLLVLLFFLTLNFNSEVLYAPSDFANEENYLRTRGKHFIELKNELRQEIKQIAQQVPEASKAKIYSVASKIDTALSQAALSQREEEILNLVASGRLTADQIAEALGISRRTAEVHLLGLHAKGLVEAYVDLDQKTRSWARRRDDPDA